MPAPQTANPWPSVCAAYRVVLAGSTAASAAKTRAGGKEPIAGVFDAPTVASLNVYQEPRRVVVTVISPLSFSKSMMVSAGVTMPDTSVGGAQTGCGATSGSSPGLPSGSPVLPEGPPSEPVVEEP